MDYPLPSNETYTIYCKSGCTYCIKAKILLSCQNPRTEIIDCDKYLLTDVQKEEFLDFIAGISGEKYRTFPMIFHKGAFIGGFTELRKYNDELLQRINAFSDEIFKV